MIDLYNLATNQVIGSVSEADLHVLTDALEEESSDDQDYYIDPPTIDLLAERGASEPFLTLLRDALGENESIDIRWEQR